MARLRSAKIVSMNPRKIILDCDPGHDDAVAMLLAQGNPNIDLLAVTTVGGNQTLEKVTYNAARLAKLFGVTAPVAAGCPRPLVRVREGAPQIHGESGIDGVELPEPVALDPRHAVDLIIDTIMEHEPGTVTLVPVGPLTNIAMAARKEPRIVERVAEVVLMGGAMGEGNWTPAAEFNIWIDPEAAHIVFNEPWPVVMIGLDLTHQALYTKEIASRLENLDAPLGGFIKDLFAFFSKTHLEYFDMEEAPIHDPCAVAYCIDPSIVETMRVPIDVEIGGELSVGRTIADTRYVAKPDCHTSAGVKLDFERFWDLIADAVERIR